MTDYYNRKLMKKTRNLGLLFLILLFMQGIQAAGLHTRLSHLTGVGRLEALPSGEFSEKYLFFIDQPVDHAHPEAGRFQQRVVVCHAGFDRPIILVTEGYGGAYALNPRYREELSTLFDANIVFVEHRYFLESTPSPVNWQYLTAENSARDLHRIVTEMKTIYPGKWISTGISKGGQTTLIYRTFFPEDVDISVPYVAPVCRGVEDGRHEPFLKRNGTPGNRRKVHNFQLEILKRRPVLMPLFETFCKEKGLTFRIPLDEVYDYCVLEYAFAFWQWGTPVRSIPGKKADNETLFRHFLQISDPSYFAESQPNIPFFVQAARELGYYGYDTEPFAGYLTLQSSKDYLRRILLPEGMDIAFDPALHDKIIHYLAVNDPKIIFIYGENDPWTAAGITDTENKKNRMVAIQPGGSHLTRIATLPEKSKKKVLARLSTWLEE